MAPKSATTYPSKWGFDSEALSGHMSRLPGDKQDYHSGITVKLYNFRN